MSTSVCIFNILPVNETFHHFLSHFHPHQTSTRNRKETSRRRKGQSSSPWRCWRGWATKENLAKALARRKTEQQVKGTFSSKRTSLFEQDNGNTRKEVVLSTWQREPEPTPCLCLTCCSLQWLLSVALKGQSDNSSALRADAVISSLTFQACIGF